MKHIAIVPSPRKVIWSQGELRASSLTWRINAPVKDVAITTKLAELKMRARRDESLPPFTLVAGDVGEMDVPQYPEGYALLVTASGVMIRGADASGLYWGMTTLEQLLMQGGALHAVEISDWPTISIRYHHDDVSRKQISRLEDFKRIIRLLSLWKINHYTLYMEDVLHLESFPDIGEGRGKLYPEEVCEIVDYGQAHKVTVFPTYSLIGHQENLLRLPKYAHLGRKVWQPSSSFDLANPAVRPFLEKVIHDVCAMWPGELFHMGFDETQGLAADEFLEHANWCARELAKYDKRPAMWVDMIYNHFGYEQIKRLDERIIPVNWQYDAKLSEIPHQKQLEKQGRPMWGLAGYGTWAAFLPDFRAGRGNYAAWVKEMARGEAWRDIGLGSSQWGDDGYENSRDLAHNAFAAFGEHAWSGEAADDESFDERFNEVFYGDQPAGVLRANELAREMSLSPGEVWRLHRARPEELQRRIAAGGLKVRKVQRDLESARETLKQIGRDRPKRNAEHLDHYAAGLERTIAVLQRIVAADEGTPAARKAAVKQIRRARDKYRDVWLRHNKPENVEVSLAVFDHAIEQWQEPEMGEWDEARYLPLNLKKWLNAQMLAIGGVPIGMKRVNGVPMRFADIRKTHVEIKAGGKVIVPLGGKVSVKDIHLVASGPRPKDGEPHPALRLRLLAGEHEVFSEDLLRIRHICDWWAPLGNHMWAGGGMAYIDPMRVQLGVIAAEYYALMHLHRFGLAGSPTADRMELEVIDDGAVQLFAVTIEKAVR